MRRSRKDRDRVLKQGHVFRSVICVRLTFERIKMLNIVLVTASPVSFFPLRYTNAPLTQQHRRRRMCH
jgi:hypothetical protein